MLPTSLGGFGDHIAALSTLTGVQLHLDPVQVLMYDEFQDKLWDDPVPPEALRWFALNGTPIEIHQVACREDLPGDAAHILASRGSADTRMDLSLNDGIPEAVVALLYRLADDDATRELVARHPNAPVELLLTTRFWQVTGLAMHNFLLKVEADSDEEEQLGRAGCTVRGQKETLGAL